MHSIKFVSDDVKQKMFAAAVRKNVTNYFTENKLSTKGNFTLVIQTVSMLSLYIIPYIILLNSPANIWWTLSLVIIMGVGMAGIGMCVMHDAVHNSYSGKVWINKIMGGTMYLLGSNVVNWKIQHNIMHHAYTNIESYDEDIAPKGPIRLSQYAPLKKIHRYQHIHAFLFYGLLTLSKLIKDFRQLNLYNKAGITQKHSINPQLEYFKMVFVKVAYLFVFIGLPVIFTSFAWWQVLTGFFIMHWVAGCILSIIFQMAHVVEGAQQFMPDDNNTIHCDWAVHELATTADFARNNLLLSWYIGGLNFQIEHHLFPNICHVHYRKIAPIVERTAQEFGFNYNLKPSFIKALGSHVQRLKQLGRAI